MRQTVLVLGNVGMLGHMVDRVFSKHPGYYTVGLHGTVDHKVFEIYDPNIVINCIGVTSRHPNAGNLPKMFEANAVLPHKIHALCKDHGARLIHISTDCVFSGDAGEDYSENDTPDPTDMYGGSKMIGEVIAGDALTIRTSLIGPELGTKRGLLEWFLSQRGVVAGFTNVAFSGLTTLEFAKVLRDHIVPNPSLHGLLHVGGPPISKYELLCGIAEAYGRNAEIDEDPSPVLNRSLNSTRMTLLTGYTAPSWPEMIREMHNDSK